MGYAMTEILELLKQKAVARSHHYDVENFVLRGIWRTEYFLRLTPEETMFHLSYVLAQTTGQGCSYYDPGDEDPGFGDSLVGQNVLEMEWVSRCMSIATLDAAYAALKGPPIRSVVLAGTNIQKAGDRARLVCDEAISLLSQSGPKHGRRKVVALIGVVGSMLASLLGQKGLVLKASDFEKRIVHRQVHGIEVQHGSMSPDLVAEADVAIITGMTLATNTLDAILRAAAENRTRLVMFAETGANFGSEYCRMGVDTVVSEPFPFYLTCSGPTRIDIYRRPTADRAPRSNVS